jgi:hypothetical protein
MVREWWAAWAVLALRYSSAADAPGGKPTKDPDKPGSTLFKISVLVRNLRKCKSHVQRLYNYVVSSLVKC